MRFLLLFTLLVLPSLARAQVGTDDCLSDTRVNNRVAGKVVYVKYKHPARDILISGYKIVLSEPKCVDFTLYTTDFPRINSISEIELMPFFTHRTTSTKNGFFKTADENGQLKELDNFLRPRIGKFVIAIGELQDNISIYYVARPQLAISALVPCEIAPKSTTVEKCP